MFNLCRLVAGKQSQANKNFWYAYALWQQKVAQALARRRAEAEARARKRAEAEAKARRVQQSNSAPSQSSSSPLAKLLKTGLLIIALGGVGLAGGSVRVVESPMSAATQMVNNLSDTIKTSCNEGLMSPLYCPFGSIGGANPAQGAASEGVASATSGDLSKVPFFENITRFISNVVLSMTLTELIVEAVSLFVQPVDLAYNLAQIAHDAINGTLGWHNVFNAIPLAGFVFRNLDLLDHGDNIGGGLGDEIGDLGDNGANNIGEQADNIPFTPDPRVIGNESFDDLVGELRNNSIRFSEEGIVNITRGFDGKIYWLETGNARAGLEHIRVRGHIPEIIEKFQLPIANEAEFANYLVHLLSTQPVHISQRTGRYIEYVYYYDLGDPIKFLAIVVGDNGFIVSAFPDTLSRGGR